MEFTVTDLGRAAKVALEGRLDTQGVGAIESRFSATVLPPARHTLVDLSGVTFLSSMGIRLLIGTARMLSVKNAKMIVFGAQPLVQESLDHVGLAEIVPVVASEAQALDLLGT